MNQRFSAGFRRAKYRHGMKRFFVTGATGFLGGRIVEELLVRGHEVRALVRDPPRANALQARGVRVYRGDIRNTATLIPPMEDCDGVFHLASAPPGENDVELAYATDVLGTRNVLKAALSLHIPRIVYTSTLAVFCDTGRELADESFTPTRPPRNDYQRTKSIVHAQVARRLLEEELPVVITIPGLLYGPGSRGPIAALFDQYLRGRLPAVPRDTYFSWSYVDDVAQAHIAAMERGRQGATYILAGPRHGLAEALDLAEAITGLRAPRLRPGRRTFERAARLSRWLERRLRLPILRPAESLAAIAGISLAGCSRTATRELGFVPRALDEGLPLALAEALERLGGRAWAA